MMFLPELFADNNQYTVSVTKKHMKKYKHLIKWKKNAAILEIGFGDGGNSKKSFFSHLPSDCAEFFATDVSESMVEYARNNSKLPLMKCAQLDIAAERVPEEFLNRFDHIFGFFVMHMVKNSKQALRNMHEMLKPDGSIFLTFFERIPLDDVLETLSKHPKWGKYRPEQNISPFYFSKNPREEWESLLIESGFTNYEIFEDEGSYEFSSEEEFDNINLAVCAFLPNIPKDEQDEFKKEYAELTKKGKMHDVEVRDGRLIIRSNYKMFITSATKSS